MRGFILEINNDLRLGSSWASVNEQEWRRIRDAETPEARAEREAAATAALQERKLTAESAKMFAYAEDLKYKYSVGKGSARHIEKRDSPCRWLYCDEKAPRSQWRQNKEGEFCAPVRDKLTGSQCWGWEYKNPKTGNIEKPRKCPYLHPGEDGWLPEWNTARTFKPTPAGVDQRWQAVLTPQQFRGIPLETLKEPPKILSRKITIIGK